MPDTQTIAIICLVSTFFLLLPPKNPPKFHQFFQCQSAQGTRYHSLLYFIFIVMSESTQTPRRRSRSRSKGRSNDNKPIRIWCPGSYDFLHYGHINFLRKVKQEMSARFPNIQLVAGIYSDQDLITKGQQPVFTADERFKMVQANKWVDELVMDAPLELSLDILKAYSCDYAFYLGQDEHLLLDHRTVINELLECGLLKTIGCSKSGNVSSHDLVNRILLLEPRDENNNTQSGQNWNAKTYTFPNSLSCKELLRFASPNVPKPSDKVVYVDGSFDVLHPGHLSLLERARALGDFLLVGLHSDDAISKYAGETFPVMQWNERAIALLSCKFVSEIIIDAPVEISEDLLKAFAVNYVVPSVDDYGKFTTKKTTISDRYKAAKQRGIFHEIVVDENPKLVGSLTCADILERVHTNWEAYAYVSASHSGSREIDVNSRELIAENLRNKRDPLQRDDDGEPVSALETSVGDEVKFRYEI